MRGSEKASRFDWPAKCPYLVRFIVGKDLKAATYAEPLRLRRIHDPALREVRHSWRDTSDPSILADCQIGPPGNSHLSI